MSKKIDVGGLKVWRHAWRGHFVIQIDDIASI